MSNQGLVRLVIGGSGYGKTHYVLQEVISEAIENPSGNYIVVVPEQFTMATQREIVNRHPNHGVLNIDIVSFNRLAFRVFEELGISNLSVLDDTGKTLILKRIIEENKDKLNIYKKKANQIGFVEEMKSAISELYSYGIDLNSFEDITEKMKDRPYTYEKLKDIRVIYKAFKEALGEEYITKEEIMDKLCEVVGRSKIIGNSRLIFDGFTGFTPVQYKLIGLLLECKRELTFTVTLPAEELKGFSQNGFTRILEQELFNMSKTTINQIFTIAADKNILIRKEDIVVLDGESSYRYRNNKELAHLEKNIFRGSDKKYRGGDGVKVYQSDNPLGEAKYIAAYINKMVRLEGYKYKDFAVIAGNLDTYRKLIETTFTENEIPYFMDNKRRLIQNPCVRAIRAAIEMVTDDFSYESVFKFLRCGVTGLSDDEIDILENYVLEYGIKGYKKYSSEFTKLRNKNKTYILEQAESIRKYLMELIGELWENISGKDKTVREITLHIYNFIEKIDIYQKLKEYEEGFEEEGKLNLSKEYAQTYGLVIELLDKIVELMGDSTITLKEYKRLIDAGLEEIKVGVIPINLDTVVIGDIQRTRLADIKVVFVVGVNDGNIPSIGDGKGLLNQKDRGYLKLQEVTLSPTVRENIFIQRFYLYQILTKPTDKLVLTYSKSAEDGMSKRPSYLIGNILDMYEDKEKMQKPEIEENIYTKEMGLKYVSENFINKHKELSAFEKELFSYFKNDKEFSKKLIKVVEGAYFTYETDNITKAVSKVLYGDDMIKSASRLEKYAACAYAHFLAYGLKLAPRRVYEINAADIGTIYHNIIEQFSKEMKKAGESFRTITEEVREKLLDICISDIFKENTKDVFFDTERNKYLISKIRQVSSKTIWALTEHIKAGDFEPEDFEMSFSDGRIDRVDTLDIDNRRFVKIIDYKSGSKKFSLDDVINGLQIQLIYYIGAVTDFYKKQNKDKTVMPAGALYFNIKSPYIERLPEDRGDSLSMEERVELEQAYEKALLKEYQMTGLVNSDREAAIGMDKILEEEKKTSIIIPIKSSDVDIHMGKSAMGSNNFTKLIEYVKNKTEKMCDEILDGNIKVNPYKKGVSTPCTYCNYKGLCTFNEKYTGGKPRSLRSYEAEQILEIIKENEDGSSKMD